MGKTELGLGKNIKDFELDKIKFNHSVWEKNAKKFKTDHSVSWGDINMINLEIGNISKYINKSDLVLDAGCSNGFSTFRIAKENKTNLHAFDFSKKSIENAIRMQKIKDPGKKINFYHGNIIDIPEKDNTFDKAYSIRVVINLLSWNLQKKAILEIHRVLKPNGIYLLSEAFAGSLNKINSLRKLADLPPLKMHKFNLYLEEKKLERFIKKYFEIVDIKKFSSIYYVASRFLRYLTMKDKEKDSFINEINSEFSKFEETENSGDFGVQKLYVLRKKGKIR